ncbi:Ammonium transporter [Phytophthora citrophthora]|uniref:Ammonium transporter n=1 Tax=Phytophthora citrophthora TaxID=4793 RepID=A0AAD9G9B2_9STRA|nr:Ammonium transporter [Phytophthora citrophthora]
MVLSLTWRSGFRAVRLQKHLRYNDTLNSFGTHGCGGFVGVPLTSLFATSGINSAIDGGALYGNGMQFVHQLIYQRVMAGHSATVTSLTLVLMKYNTLWVSASRKIRK